MFKKSDYFILAAVMLSFLVSAFQWFVQQDIGASSRTRTEAR